jgi:hypothetical protein
MRKPSRIKRRGCTLCKAHRRHVVLSHRIAGGDDTTSEKPDRD